MPPKYLRIKHVPLACPAGKQCRYDRAKRQLRIHRYRVGSDNGGNIVYKPWRTYCHSRFIFSQASLIDNCPSSVLILGSLG